MGLLFVLLSNRSIENIEAGIGIQAGNMLRDVALFFIGIMWAFTINWKLALVVLSLLPVVSFFAGVHIVVCIYFTLLICDVGMCTIY